MKPLMLDEIASAIRARPLGQLGRYHVTGVGIDSREARAGELFFAIRGERFDGHTFVASAIDQGAMAAVVSRPDLVPDDLHQLGLLLLVDDTTAALGRLAAFHRRQVRARVIAVTGSNGKTTTKEMIHHMLSGRRRGRAAPKSFNNAVGVPLTLLSVEPNDDYVVVEIGSNAPGEVGALAEMASPHVGVITSIAETHLEKLESLEGVAREKAGLIDSIREGGCAVVTADSDPLAKELRRRRKRGIRWVRFGRGEGADLRATQVRAGPDHVSFRVDDGDQVTIPMPGEHNALNALAAMAAVREFGIDLGASAERLSGFTAPPMRCEVHRWGGVTVINDAYNANPASMSAALDVLSRWPDAKRRVVVVGDMRELGASSLAKHQQLGRQVAAAGVDVLMAVGEYADVVAEIARQSRADIEVATAATADDAAEALSETIRSGDVIMVKGSRALGLEALVEAIRSAVGKTPARR
jgi:UDP-N-acetylmuramoyl-tripeptide--D-alanyl-D-alanine ligase